MAGRACLASIMARGRCGASASMRLKFGDFVPISRTPLGAREFARPFSLRPFTMSFHRSLTSRAVAVVLFAVGAVASAQGKVHLKIATTAEAMDAFSNWT